MYIKKTVSIKCINKKLTVAAESALVQVETKGLQKHSLLNSGTSTSILLLREA